MDQVRRTSCCVCETSDARLLVEVPLADGERAWLCGSHALLHSRTTPRPKTEAELKAALRDRRGRRDRRHADDELGAMLAAAFSGGRRLGDRRRA